MKTHLSKSDPGPHARASHPHRPLFPGFQLGGIAAALLAGLWLATTTTGFAAGTLMPRGSADQSIQIQDHQVKITINNGFAQTEVLQSFYNPNDKDLEAIYTFPLPRSASLSEVTLTMGEREIEGEVIERGQAETIYEDEKSNGNDAGLAEKNGYQNFQFKVHPVRAQDETRIRIVYYQPLEIDTGIGRYVYPLEEGGTDDLAASFWDPVNAQVEGLFSADIELKSAWPIADVRLPGFENDAVTDKLDDGHYRVRLEKQDHALTRDLVVYYRLADDLPGRVEVIPYRADPSKPGTFMMVVTPGIDLKPLEHGADYVYVLDTSGSMTAKLNTLVDGITRVLGKMSPQDRFRIITFSDHAGDLMRGWQAATPSNVERALKRVEQLHANGSTNLYEGLSLAIDDIDADRATSIVLVTDGVTNTGIVDPVEFHKLTTRHDIRIFGFLMGNSANWPLMRTVCDSSGGFYAGVSNADDILGQIMQAKSKIVHECLHHAEFKIKGVKTFDTSGTLPGKIYRGQQLVMFGRYAGEGDAELILNARLTGEDKTYRTRFTFPKTDTANPEIERLWALDQVEQIELDAHRGNLPSGEASVAIRDLGVNYQLVTDETSMLVLADDVFKRHGIERRNRERILLERTAQSARTAAPLPVNHRVDKAKPFTPSRSHSFGGGGGGGALSPWAVIAVAAFLLAGLMIIRRQGSNASA